jgi:hypothetical protein
MSPVVTLLTDFGTPDGYVGEMKGVVLSAAPTAALVDISHDIAPQDVEGARLALARYWRRFPPGTVHLVVVDPGVGTDRAAIAIESDGRRLVGPDNGVLSPALLIAGARVVRVPIPENAAPTFHGRDVFAPAAARLAMGAPLDDVGPAHQNPIILRTPEPHRLQDGGLSGCVLTIDRFGNAVTNLMAWREGTIEVAGRSLPIRRTYADGAAGEMMALVGASGLIEVAVRDGNAARVLGLARGTLVILRPAR